MNEIRVFTIGFTQKTAQHFFTSLREAGVQRVVDVRLNNTSQLAGFAKRDDLIYFLKELVGAQYLHAPSLAPTQDMLDDLKKHKGSWQTYEQRFMDLMAARRVENELTGELLHKACLLCSEHKPDHCHRRLVLEYLSKHFTAIKKVHLT